MLVLGKHIHSKKYSFESLITSPTHSFVCTGDKDIDHQAASLSKIIQGKTKPVIWFVSNCLARSGRQEFVNELSKHIPVDVYGRCGSRYCSRSKDCFAEIAEPEYFFYLSLENSLCADYVTEKLYNALR